MLLHESYGHCRNLRSQLVILLFVLSIGITFGFQNTPISYSSAPSKVKGVSTKSRLLSWNHEKMSLSTANELFSKNMHTAFRCLYSPFIFGMASGSASMAPAFKTYLGNRHHVLLHGFSHVYQRIVSIAKEKGER